MITTRTMAMKMATKVVTIRMVVMSPITMKEIVAVVVVAVAKGERIMVRTMAVKILMLTGPPASMKIRMMTAVVTGAAMMVILTLAVRVRG